MRTLEEIKKKYLSDPWFNRPYDEEIEHYGLNQSIYKEWITEELLEFKKILFLKIDQFDNVFNSIDEFNHKNMLFSDIYSIFNYCMEYYPAVESYYLCLPDVMKKMYENNMFDYITYDSNKVRYSRFARLVYYLRPQDRGTMIDWDRGKKYTGMLIQVYYNNPKVFNELLLYFANVIYQKYGLYLQYDMSILIQFCYEYNLPYLDILYEAHKKAKELDYPSNYEYKYQLIKRKEIKWEDDVLKLRSLEEIKDNYLNNTSSKPTKHEEEFYSITEDTLKKWLSEK